MGCGVRVRVRVRVAPSNSGSSFIEDEYPSYHTTYTATNLWLRAMNAAPHDLLSTQLVDYYSLLFPDLAASTIDLTDISTQALLELPETHAVSILQQASAHTQLHCSQM